MKYLFKITFFFLLLLFSSCFSNRDAADAETAAHKVFEMMQSENYSDSDKVYCKSFFTNVSKEQWKETLKSMNEKYGKLKSFEVIEIEAEYNLTTPNDIIIQHEATHEYSTSHHRFLIMKEDGEYKVFGHHIKL